MATSLLHVRSVTVACIHAVPCCWVIARTQSTFSMVLATSPFRAIFPDQNTQSSSTDLIAQSNFSRSVLEKKRSIGTPNFLEKTTVRRGSM